MSTRRQFVIGGTSLVTLVSTAVAASAEEGEPGNAAASADEHPQSVVLFREEETASVLFATALQHTGMHSVALERDVVRQWLDLNKTLRGSKSSAVFGLTNWSDLQIVKGLAAEHRLFLRSESRLPGGSQLGDRQVVSIAMSLYEAYNQNCYSALDMETGAAKTSALFSWVIA